MDNIVLSIQAAYDLLFAGVLFYMHLESKKQKDLSKNEHLQAALAELQNKYTLIEKDTLHQKKELEDSLKRLHRVIDKMTQTLSPMAFNPSQNMTQEEKEIRILLKEEVSPSQEIPSLLEIEQTRSRLRDDTQLDLKTVLRSQLC